MTGTAAEGGGGFNWGFFPERLVDPDWLLRCHLYSTLMPMTALFAIITKDDAVLGMDCLLKRGTSPIYEWSMKSARLGDRCCIGFQGADDTRNPIFCRHIVRRPELEGTGAPLSVWERDCGMAGLDYLQAKARLEEGIRAVINPVQGAASPREARFAAILIGEIDGKPCGSQWWLRDNWAGTDVFHGELDPVLGLELTPDEQQEGYSYEEVWMTRTLLLRPGKPKDRIRKAIHHWAGCASNQRRHDVNGHLLFRSLSEDCRANWEPGPPSNWPCGDPTLTSSSACPSTGSCT